MLALCWAGGLSTILGWCCDNWHRKTSLSNMKFSILIGNFLTICTWTRRKVLNYSHKFWTIVSRSIGKSEHFSLLTFFSASSHFRLVHWSTKANLCLVRVPSLNSPFGDGKPRTVEEKQLCRRLDFLNSLKRICPEIWWILRHYYEPGIDKTVRQTWFIYLFLLWNCTDRSFSWFETGNAVIKPDINNK